MLFLFSADAAATPGGGSLRPMLAVYAVFIVVLYFIMIRPQRRRQKETDKMQNSISIGNWVLLNNGMYGKVVNIVNDCLMVEFGTNKSVIIPVRRDQILGITEPDLTQKTVDETAIAPKDELVGEDLEEDGLDEYDKYLIEQEEKKNGKKGVFKKKN